MLREFFHLMHMVDDFDAADTVFHRVFDPEVFMEKSWSDLDRRWASLARVGPDFVWELIEASTAEEDADRPIPKFVRRFGHHLHSFSWYIEPETIVPTVRRLQTGGVRVAGPHGLLPDDVSDEQIPHVVFTHPKDTFGQIELMSKTERLATDPVFRPDWDRWRWRDDHPLGIQRVAHLTNSVDDLDRAKQVFGDLLGGNVFHEVLDEHSERAYVLVGVDTVIELARPVDPTTRLARDLKATGPLPHMVTFRVGDLDAAAAHLEATGVAIAERSDTAAVVDPEALFGALVCFTTQDLPDDPRD